MSKFIVAEVSKSWIFGLSEDDEILSQKFEKVININHERGYDLEDWKINSTVNDNRMNETIIAIFKKRE